MIVAIPFDVQKTWNSGGRLKVKGEINGFPFRTSLFTFSKPVSDEAFAAAASRRAGHFLLINKKMQRGGKAAAGSVARICLQPDADARHVTVPPELKRILGQDRSLVRWFEALNYSTRKWIIDWVTDPKSREARKRRAEQVCEQLLATMEAEQELPPALRIAFAGNPTATDGWRQMTPVQRRGQLLAIFYYRSPEARARRVEKVLELAAQVAERKSRRKAEGKSPT